VAAGRQERTALDAHLDRWRRWRHRLDLIYLARHFGTDKWGRHNLLKNNVPLDWIL
jgi:hypothetical protein